ncbi:hypothetical protein ACSHT0_06500 [Tepidicaulis sp. LMO-SS28]|uniref:hypothetical protein n=1 Tax=Tepidicaulis sp. LMO-SS28 TaxID=3447455 RepID=UPI003EDF410D
MQSCGVHDGKGIAMKIVWGIVLVVCLGIAGIGLINLTATAETDFTVAVDGNAAAEDRALIERAATVLKARCPLLTEHASQIVEARGVATDIYREPAEDLGWEREVEITVKLSDDADGLPLRAREARAWGNTLHYFVGFGGQEGIDIMKDASQTMCAEDVRLGNGGNVFVPVQTSQG